MIPDPARQSNPDAPSALERVSTADGASIACKRRRAPGTPVILVHGLALNADLWDIPELALADGRLFTSLATMLHRAGHDLWLVNLRGHGAPHMESTPPPGMTDWCVDHFVLYDLDAVVRHVVKSTNRRPFVVANSMGAMTTAGWLQGATLSGDRIVASESEARQRDELVSGAVLIEFPAQLRWPQTLYDERGRLKWADLVRDWRRDEADLNFSFEWLSRLAWLEMLLASSGEVPLSWLRPGSWRAALPPAIARHIPQGERVLAAGMRFFSERLKGAKSFHPELFLQGMLHAVDHLKAGVLKQLAKSVRARSFVSALGAADHDYAAHYDRIRSPLLTIAGGRDRIACAPVIREAFHERIASADKTYLLYDDIAHGEFEYSQAACERVYPEIVAWITARNRRA